MSTNIEKSWGYEQLLHNGVYCAKLLVYTRPIRSSLHYHERKHETFYVASGVFEIQVGVGDRPLLQVRAGFHIVLPPQTRHRIRCIEPGTIVESSSHDDPADCVRLEPSDP